MDENEGRRLYQEACAAWEAEDWAVSAAAYERLLAVWPDGEHAAVWWFDAALAHKFLRDWEKAYALGREAAARAPRGDGDPAFWNLGIAATALRDWPTARDAWAGFGIDVPEGEGPIEGRFGMACVRLDTDGQREVVWVERLCPTRGRVVSVPVTAGRRFGEVVLHDGAPSGERIVEGRAYAVFDELMRFEPSELPTLSVRVEAPDSDAVEQLIELFTAAGYGAEPASGVTLLCSCCSEGSHEQQRSVHAGEQRVALAAPEAGAARLLAEWQEKGVGRTWHGLTAVG